MRDGAFPGTLPWYCFHSHWKRQLQAKKIRSAIITHDRSAKRTSRTDRKNNHALPLVAAGNYLPGLSALVHGQQRRRRGRPRGADLTPGLPALAPRRLRLDLAALPVADERLRLRCGGLYRDPPVVRHAR